MSIRSTTAVWAGKLTTKILKLAGKGATALPGKVVRNSCPDILKYLAGDMKIICVTGTNGKTTTCHVIRDMIEAKGKDEALFRLVRNLKYKTNYKFIDDTTFEVN